MGINRWDRGGIAAVHVRVGVLAVVHEWAAVVRGEGGAENY